MGGAAVTSIPESVVAAKVVRNDGRTPFLRPQKGVAPVDGDDLVTRAWALATFGAGVSDGNKGDVTVSGGGSSWLLNADVVTDAKLRNSAALSVIGRNANSTGDPGDIAAANDGEVLRRSGTSLGFGTIATAGIADGAVTNAKLRNCAALSVIGRGANSAGAPADIAATAASGGVLRESGSAIGFGTVATAGIEDNAVTNAKLRDSAALSVVGRSANSTGDPGDIAASTDGHVLRRSGTSLGFGTLAASAFADNTIALGRLANLSGPGYVGRGATGAGAAALIGVATPTRVTPTADDVFHKFNPTTGAIERCSWQELLDFIADYFGISPP